MQVTETDKTCLLEALAAWRREVFQREFEGKEFLGPQSVVTNGTIRQIVEKCGDLAQVQDLQTIATLKASYHSAVHNIITNCVGTFEGLESNPKKSGRKTSRDRKRPTSPLHLQPSPKRRPLQVVN